MAATTASGKKRARNTGATNVVLERTAASAQTRALDKALFVARGHGLAIFVCRVWEEREFGSRPLLVLYMDEASCNMAMSQWMLYHSNLRVIRIRDIFHREWNDVQLALKQAGLWWVVVLTSVAFNFVYGPWQGSALIE